jgi:hypothetical protein
MHLIQPLTTRYFFRGKNRYGDLTLTKVTIDIATGVCLAEISFSDMPQSRLNLHELNDRILPKFMILVAQCGETLEARRLSLTWPAFPLGCRS